MELPSHKHILSYSIFPEYCFRFFDYLRGLLISIEMNTPFYRPSDHFIVDQINNITDVYNVLLVLDMSLIPVLNFIN